MGSTIRADLAPVTDLADDLAGQKLDKLVGDISYAIKLQALHIAEKVTGGDRRLSRFGTKNSKGKTRMGVNYKVTGGRSEILMKPAALWVMTDGGARAHMIGAGKRTRKGRYQKRSKKAGPMVLKYGGRYVSGPVRHPGTRGPGALKRVHAQIPRIVSEILEEALTVD